MKQRLILLHIWLIGTCWAIGNICPRGCSCLRNGLHVKCFQTDFSILPENISTNVTALQFVRSRIKEITQKMFTNYKRLQHIIMTHNEIDFVDPSAFKGLDNLERLDLSSNGIRNFPWNFIADTPKLSMLYLRNNFITNIPSESELRGLKQLKSLRIKDNNFVCSCNFSPMAKWLQENEKSMKSRKLFTVLDDKTINCSTELSWITVLFLNATTQDSKNQQKCSQPNLEMYSLTTPDQVHPGKRRARDLSVESESYLEDLMPDGLYQRPLPPLMSVWNPFEKDVATFVVAEEMNLRVICNITNKKDLRREGEYMVKAAIVKNLESVDINRLKNWSCSNEIVIHQARQDIHDGLGVICVVESIPGTIAKAGVIRVVKLKQLDSGETEIIPGTTRRISSKVPFSTEQTSEKAGTNQQQTTLLKSKKSMSPAITSTPDGTPTLPFHSACRQNYSDLVINSVPENTSSHIRYRHSFEGVLNITMTADETRGRIIVTVTSSTQTANTIFLCHSDKSTTNLWMTVKTGTGTREVVPPYGKPGTMCVFSTRFNTEVCGAFPAMNGSVRSMTVMVAVGVAILSLATVIMILCGLHHAIVAGIERISQRTRKR